VHIKFEFEQKFMHGEKREKSALEPQTKVYAWRKKREIHA
jgi:hypothetical protein